jgi:hypothetical protein
VFLNLGSQNNSNVLRNGAVQSIIVNLTLLSFKRMRAITVSPCMRVCVRISPLADFHLIMEFHDNCYDFHVTAYSASVIIKSLLLKSKYVVETKLNSVALARNRTIPTESPLVGEVSANFGEQRMSCDQCNGSPCPLISVF